MNRIWADMLPPNAMETNCLDEYMRDLPSEKEANGGWHSVLKASGHSHIVSSVWEEGLSEVLCLDPSLSEPVAQPELAVPDCEQASVALDSSLLVPPVRPKTPAGASALPPCSMTGNPSDHSSKYVGTIKGQKLYYPFKMVI